MNLLAGLQILDVSENSIQVVPDLTELSALTEFKFADNDVQFIADVHFASSILVEITLDDNPLKITNLTLPITLTMLSMKKTYVETLTLQCQIPNSCRMKILTLESNMTETPIINDIKESLIQYSLVGSESGIPSDGMQSDAFADLPNLVYMYLINHQFDPFEAFRQLNNSVSISMLIMKLLEITDTSLLFQSTGIVSMDALRYLSLGENNLTVIPNLRTLTKMTSLLLHDNAITFISRSILSGMKSLKELHLEDNPIVNPSDIPYRFLTDLRNLYLGFVNL